MVLWKGVASIDHPVSDLLLSCACASSLQQQTKSFCLLGTHPLPAVCVPLSPRPSQPRTCTVVAPQSRRKSAGFMRGFTMQRTS